MHLARLRGLQNGATDRGPRTHWPFRWRRLTRSHQGTSNGHTKRLGVVVVDHGSRRREANALLEAVVSSFQAKTQLDIVEAAHMELAKPDIADALCACVNRGAEHVIVSPFFLSPGRHSQEDIPRLIEEAIDRFHLRVTYAVTEPFGTDPLIVDILQRRVNGAIKDAVTGK